MKRREKILLTSLQLFNDEGEPNVTTVDIANEMDISPGNLYYHFKGKEQLIDELFDRFEHSITDVLQTPIEKILDIQDNWFYLYVIFEEIYHYRFFYRNLTDILSRYPMINRKFSRLLNLKAATATAICLNMKEQGILEINDKEIAQLAEQFSMTLSYWLNYIDLRSPKESDEMKMHHGVFHIFSLFTPYLGEHSQEFNDSCQLMYQTVTNQ